MQSNPDVSARLSRCEERVATWRWAADDWLIPIPFYHERSGYRRGTLLAKEPRSPRGRVLYGIDEEGRPLVAKKYHQDSESRHDITLYEWSASVACSYSFRDAARPVNATCFELDGVTVRAWARVAIYGDQHETIDSDEMGRPFLLRQVSQERGKKPLRVEHSAEYSTHSELAFLRARVNDGVWTQVFPRTAR